MTMYVKPAHETLRVRDPLRGDVIEHTGRRVPQDVYWMRRLRDGDVVQISDFEQHLHEDLVAKDVTDALVEHSERSDEAEVVKAPSSKSKKKDSDSATGDAK